MRHKHYKRERKSGYLSKLIIAVAVVAVVTISSIVGVMANTISCTVEDGEKSYSFNLLTPDTDGILAKATELGMEPLNQIDKAIVNSVDSVTVLRGKYISVNNNGEFVNALAYNGQTVKDVLISNKISYSDESVVTPDINTLVDDITSINLSNEVTVTVNLDGKTRGITLEGGTVADALAIFDIQISESDRINFEPATKLKDKMAIVIKTAKNILVSDDGIVSEYTVYSSTVRNALKELSLELGEEDILSPSLNTRIQAGDTIDVTRIQYVEVTETEEIEFSTVYENSSDLYEGETQTKSQGVNGEKEVLYRELYKNGELVDRVAVKETVVTEAVNEVTLKGTKKQETTDDSSSNNSESTTKPDEIPVVTEPTGNTFVDYNGDTVAYSQVLYGSGTAAYIPGGTTSIGMTAEYGVIAVDPDIIPYGTWMYVIADGLVYGYGIAGDTGGALMAGDALVDVYYNSLEECYVFGRRNCTVYILS